MNALITGGAGFIGSHLAEAILGQGGRVVAIDNLSTGQYTNVTSLEKHPQFSLIVDSVLNKSLLEQLVRDAGVVFHLASAVGVRLIIEKPVETIETIVQGTDMVLNAAKRYRKPVLITSTSEVYGKGSKIPFSENDDTVLGPTTTRRWSYACSKMLDEFMALAHWYTTRLPVVCARLFNTVGPRQTGQYGMVLPRFVQQALSNQPITVYGDGNQSRCFGHVYDVVGALIALIKSDEAHGRVVNVGSNEEVSMNELAQRVIKLTSSSSTITHIPYEQAYIEGFEDMQRRVPDLTLAGKLIGYKPTRNLDQIIADIVETMK